MISRIFFVGVLSFLILPIAIIVLMSFSADQYYIINDLSFSLQWYKEFIADPKWLNAMWNSLLVGSMSISLSLSIGVPAALWIHDNKRYQNILIGVIILPIIIPPLISAVSWYFALSFIGWDNNLMNMVVGHFLLGVPFVVICTLTSLEKCKFEIEQMALICGANKYKVFTHIQLPIILPGILAGAMLAFMTSFDELIVSLFLSSYDTRTIPLEMWSGLRENISPVILVVTTITTIFSLITMIVVKLTDDRYSSSYNTKA